MPARLLWSGKTSQKSSSLKNVGTLNLRKCSPASVLLIRIRAKDFGGFWWSFLHAIFGSTAGSRVLWSLTSE